MTDLAAAAARLRADLDRGDWEHGTNWAGDMRLVLDAADAAVAQAPADAMSQRDADVWDEGAEYAVGYATAPLYDNPYRGPARREGTSS